MKKLLMLSLMAMILILGACSKDDKEAATTPGKKLDNTEQAVEVKDNELVIEVDGKQETIPAKVEKNISFAKEIKVPENADVVKNNEDGAIIITDGEKEMFVGKTKIFAGETDEELIESYKRKVELTSKEGLVPVADVDLTKYPDLKGYKAVRVEKPEYIGYYLIKVTGETEAEEVGFKFPPSEKEQNVLATMVAIIKSIK